MSMQSDPMHSRDVKSWRHLR